MLFCLVGPSGCGKSTVANELSKRGYKNTDSYTTRPKRSEDETGHTFITEEEFDKLTDMVAYTKFNGFRYCVTKSMLDQSDIYIIDPAGVKTLKENYDNSKFKTIGFVINQDECRKRMINRGDSDTATEERLVHDKEAFKNFEKNCDYLIDASLDLNIIVDRILEYIKLMS